MGNKNSRSLKRSKKLKARKKHRGEIQENLAYFGNKYKTPDIVPLHLEAETAIFECFTMLKRSLTDHDIKAALVQMALDIRRGKMKPMVEHDDSPEASGSEQDFIILNIRCHWGRLFDWDSAPGRDTFVGVLRTILGSIETWSTPASDSRGYLAFLEKFLDKCGDHVPFFQPGEAFNRAALVLDGDET